MTMNQAPNHHLTTVRSPDSEISPESALVWTLHDKLGSWEAIADTLGFSGMFWWKVAHGRAKLKSTLTEKSLLKSKAQNLTHARQRLRSSDPKFLRLMQQGAVPYLRERER